MRPWFAVVALIAVLGGATVARAASLSSETDRLEGLKRGGHASSGDRAKLAQVYFLTSRCADAKGIADDAAPALACVCGGRCDPRSRLGRIMKLKALLERHVSWSNRELQSLWKDIAQMPEAQYLLLRYINTSPLARKDARLRQLRGEIEGRLQSLEVKP